MNRRILRSAVCFALATVFTGPLAAQLSPLGEPFRVNSNPSLQVRDHYSPEVEAMPAGGFVVAWSIGYPEARRFNANGSPTGTDFMVSDLPNRSHYTSRLAPYPDGSFAIVWQESRFVPPICIHAQRIDSETQIGNVLSTCEATPARPAVATFPDGGLVVAWDGRADDRPAKEIRAKVYNLDGIQAPTLRISAAAAADSERLLVDVGSWDDGFVVVWRDHQIGAGTAQLRARRYNRSGEAQGGSYKITDTLDPLRGEVADGRMAVSSAGRSVIVWSERIDPGESDRRIRARIYDERGESVTAPIEVFQSSGGEGAFQPAVAIDSAGNFVVVWRGYECGATCAGSRLRGRLFDRHGVARGPVEEIDVGAGDPTVAMSDDGLVFVTYETASIFSIDIIGRLYQANFEGSCTPDERTLCLNDGRFQVQVDWEKPNGETGIGRVVPAMSADTGIFWFFNAANWELLVKVLNGCERTGHYWVFSAATTNVRYELTVTDMLTQQRRTYVNPQGIAAAAVTDTAAFATCP